MRTSAMTSLLTQPMPVTLPCSAVSLVVVSAVDELFTSADARLGARWLGQRVVPLALVTGRPAGDVLALQADLGARRPFVCGGGAELHVPIGYFPELTRIGIQRDGWNIVEFKPPYEAGHAVRFLISLFRLCSDQALIVGLAASARDRALLHEVDVPVVVRTDTPADTELLQAVPAAYLTNARGAAGWNEAILGSITE